MRLPSGQPKECCTRPGPVRLGRHFPQLLQADAVFLGIAAGVEREAADEALGQRAAGALGHQHVSGPELHAARVAVRDGAVAADAHVARRDAHDLAVLAVEHLDGREAGIDLDAQRLRLPAEVARHVGERAHEVAVVAHQLGHEGVRQPHAPRRAEVVEAVVGDLDGQRPVVVDPPFGDQRVEPGGVDHDARQDVAADLGALLQHDDGKVGPELLQADGRGEAGRPCADHHDVELHRFARRRLEGRRRAVALGHVDPVPARPRALSRDRGPAAQMRREAPPRLLRHRCRARHSRGGSPLPPLSPDRI